ncbi:putative RNA methyltransferase [Nakamurella sp. PAMC28650]|uniref:putative RNA methyltransferase n=1 Tax=Nakamurella sp. PAMC28650 TaxID=2762325 RepID=UPI001C9A45DB|nr:hypothetical protein [Nakamurella sp. PAMC28650]
MKPGRVRPSALHHPTVREHLFPPAALQALACPHCGSHLVGRDGTLICASGHPFDVARAGYVALLGPRARTDTGDTADMVSARIDFLGSGHYAPIAGAVGAAAVGAAAVGGGAVGGWEDGAGHPGPVLEIGAGTGYYLRAALGPPTGTIIGAAGIALDSSRYAARRAAADPRVLSVLADAWSVLPLQTASVATVLSVFAPRDPAEIARVLVPGGRLVAVTPTPSHLVELRPKLDLLAVDEGKAERLAESFTGLLAPVDRQDVSFRMDLAVADVSALVRMGPSVRHLTPEALQDQIAGLDEIETVTGEVTVSIFEKQMV